MKFQGYTQETVDFMWGIRFNNEREWFLPRKEIYQRELLEPTKALAEDVYDGLHALLPHEPLTMKVSRIYRDARRLFGRGPYKDHLWFCVRSGDDDWQGKPTFYFEIGPDYYSYGLGFWEASSQTMERFRRRTAEKPEELEKMVRKIKKQGVFTLQGQEYARKKPSPSQLLEPWFQKKNLLMGFEAPLDESIFHPELAERVTRELGELVPLYRYLSAIAAQAD